MKLALLNLANNINGFKTTPSGETTYMKLILEDMGYEVDIISNKATEYTIPFEDVKDINAYDRLLCLNGAINFFGGKESPTIINNFKLMAQFKGTIYYLFTDLRLPFNQLWPAIENRGWGYKKEEVWIDSPVVIISQGYNLDTARRLHKKAEANTKLTYDWVRLDRHKLYQPVFSEACESVPREDKVSDIIYGGSFRGGQREAKMNEYLFDTGLDVEFFGTAKETQFKNPKFPWTQAPRFVGKVPMCDMLKRNSQGLATIVIGDSTYNDNYITPRVWETMVSDAVMFIDHEFNTAHDIINDERFYVHNKEEFVSRVKAIKEDETLRLEMLRIQHETLAKAFAEKPMWQNEFMKAINAEIA